MARGRDELLDAAIEYAAREGLADFSMRACAEAVGTSHRMLGYHFGPKDRLITTIIDTVGARQRAIIDGWLAQRPPEVTVPTAGEVDEALRGLLLDEDNLRFAALMAEATYRVAGNPGRYQGDAPTYPDIVRLWRPHVVGLFGLHSLPADQREARVRLAIAVLVGLSMDYLGSRDAEAYLQAYREWIRMNLGV